MVISEKDIQELADFRPYEEMSASSLKVLLDAFEEFIPSLEHYGDIAESVVESQPNADQESTPSALKVILAAEPEVSRALFEILLELSLRREENAAELPLSESDGDSDYEGWEERGLLYGFDGETIEATLKLRREGTGA